MAFDKTSNGGKLVQWEETYTLPASATTEYSTVIDGKVFGPDTTNNNRYVTFCLNASAVSGTNLDLAIYGSDDESGTTKFLLQDAIVTDITATGENVGVLDINTIPAMWYFVAWTSDADESSNTITLRIVASR